MFQGHKPSDRNTYAVFSGEVCTEGHERTIDREPKEYDNEHSAWMASQRGSRRVGVSSVPNGTAPEESRATRIKLRTNTTANTNLRRTSCQHVTIEGQKNAHVGSKTAAKNTTFLRSEPSDMVRYVLVATYPLIAPKNVQEMSITVASDPRFEGDRKPSKAKTAIPWSTDIKGCIKKVYTQSDTDHNDHLRAIPDKNAERYYSFRATEDFTVDKFPSAASC